MVVRGMYGAPPAWFPEAELGPILDAIRAVPTDAVLQRAHALVGAIDEPDYRDPAWLARLLDALGDAVRAAARDRAGFLVQVA
jgi:hypothetical protein